MKILRLFLFIGFFSFHSYGQSEQLIGRWTVFQSDAPVASIDCETCATWEFKSDHTAIFTNPGAGKTDSLTWSVDANNMLSFVPADLSTVGAKRLATLKFTMSFKKLENYTEFRMITPGQKMNPVLRKK